MARKKDPLKKRKHRFIRSSIILTILLFLFFFGKFTHRVERFGIRPNDLDAAKKNYVRLQVLTALHLSGGEIHFGEGTYYLDGTLKIIGNQSLVLSGEGNTKLVNTVYSNERKEEQPGSGVLMAFGTHMLTIEDLGVDYLDYTNVYGEILQCDLHGMQLQLPEAALESFEKTGHRPLQGKQHIAAMNTYDSEGNILNDVYTNEEVTGSFDPETGIYTIQYAPSTVGFVPGNFAEVRFALNNQSPAFTFLLSKNTRIRNVRVYSTPQSTVFGYRNFGRFMVEGLHIEAEEGSVGRWGSNCDGIHLNNQAGNIGIRGSQFIGMGDDAFNCNSLAIRVNPKSPKELSISDPTYSGQLRFLSVKRGDTLRFYSQKMEPLGEAEVRFYKKGKVILKTPVRLPETCYAAVTRYMPVIKIQNCTVRDGRARAFLLRSERIEVSDCDISNLGLVGIIIAADVEHWYEMAPSSNVTIRNNTFTNCATETASQNFGIIMIKNSDDGNPGVCTEGTFKDITITDNTFTSCGTSALYATGVDGLTFTGNIIEGQIDRLGNIKSAKALRLSHCTNVTTDIAE